MMDHLRQHWMPSIRVQLTLWYTAVFSLLMLLFGMIFYTALQSELVSSLNSTLQLRTQQIATGVSYENGSITIQDVTGELPGLASNGGNGQQEGNQTTSDARLDVNFGTLVRILNAQGQTVYVTPAFRTLTAPAASITQVLGGTPWQGTITARDGQEVRLYSTVLSKNGKIFGVVQVGESIASLTATLSSVVTRWLLISPFVLALGALGSYWLAKRAFRPIHRLTRTAQYIKAGDLHQRVPVPRTKDEVQQLALTLNEMIERLDQAFARQHRFVADVSHELRTPVAVICSMSEVALEEPITLEECVSVLNDVKTEGERLGQLINDLLSLARADEGQLLLDHEEVRLDLLSLEVAAAIEPLTIERGISLRLEKLEPAIVLGDMTRLIQVLLELVNNAIRYTNVGGTVTLNVAIVGSNASVSVQDTGIGIAPEDIAHIFERFYRADPARSRSAGGSGLGLAIIDWVVRIHGGTISVESQVGQGSTFIVTLPLARSTAALTLAQSKAVETLPLRY